MAISYALRLPVRMAFFLGTMALLISGGALLVAQPDIASVMLAGGVFAAAAIAFDRRSLTGSERLVPVEANIAGAVSSVSAAEEQLRETDERFHLLAEATNDGVYDWDVAGGTIWFSDTYFSLFGHERGATGDVVSLWKENIHPDDRERVGLAFSIALESGQRSWSDEYQYRRGDGVYVSVLDRAHIVHSTSMKVTRVIGAMTDITEQRQLQNQLAQAKRVSSLGRVAASIAHEFNNVLMGIQPNLEIVRRMSPPGLAHPIENIMHSVRRGKRVTDEILKFTRPPEPAAQTVRVRDFLTLWDNEIRPALGSNVDLVIEASPDACMEVDPLQIAQVFSNLAVNARDAIGESRGTLTISGRLATSFASFPFGVVRSADRYVQFTIRDTGCGMSQEQMRHIFEPLFTTKKNGTGLGLAVSYQLVLQHHGHIFVESELGKGSVFHLFLPAGLNVWAEAPQPESPCLKIKRVLLIEDELAVATGMKTLLEMEGCTVAMVHTGGEAMPAIESFQPDCVILDIGLPDMDGTETFRAIRAKWDRLPVLFSSGHADATRLENTLSQPHVGLLRKPYDFEMLCHSLAELTLG